MRGLIALFIVLVAGLSVGHAQSADDLAALKAEFRRPAEAAPEPADNPSSPAKMRLGWALFQDRRLSGDQSLACVDCHQPERDWQDGRARAQGMGGHTLKRRTPTLFDTARDSAVVATPALTLVKAVSDASGPPGTLMTYTVTWLSNGSTPAYNVAIIDPVPPETAYEPGSASGAGATIEFSHDGGHSFDGSEAAPVTHLRWSFPAPLAPGETGQVSFQAAIR